MNLVIAAMVLIASTTASMSAAVLVTVSDTIGINNIEFISSDDRCVKLMNNDVANLLLEGFAIEERDEDSVVLYDIATYHILQVYCVSLRMN